MTARRGWLLAGVFSVAVGAFFLIRGALAPGTNPAAFAVVDGAARVQLGAWWVDVSGDGTLGLSTGAARIGLRALLPKPTGPLQSAAEPGAVTLPHGDIVERWSLQGGAIEQQWRVDHAPPGRGPLALALELNAGTLATAAEDGALLQSAGQRVRYGAATWVDARGVRTPVGMQVVGERLLLEVPRGVLNASAYPAVLDPTVSPEQPVSVDTAAVSVVGQQSQPSVAVIGGTTTALAVWADTRRQASMLQAETDIYGALVDLTGGMVTVQRQFAIAVGPGVKQNPVVAASPGGFLVVWQDNSGASDDLYGALIPPSGLTTRPVPFVVQNTAQNEILPAVAYSAPEAQFLVVYDSTGGNGPIAGVRVDPSTSPPTVGKTITLSASANAQTSPRVAWSGAQYVVVWNDIGAASNIFYATLAQGATTPGASTQIASAVVSTKESPDVIGGPNEHLVVWADNRTASTFGLFGTIVQSNGTLSSVAGISLRQTANVVGAPRGSFMNTGNPAYAVTFPEFNNSLGTGTATTEWFAPGTLALFGSTGDPQSYGDWPQNGVATACDSNFLSLVAYADALNVYFAAGLTVGSLNLPPQVLTALPAQTEARAASLGGDVIVGWPQWDGFDGGFDLFYRRFNWDGGTLDAAPLPLAVGPGSPNALQLAAGTNEAYAVYSAIPSGGNRPDVFAGRIVPSGALGPVVNVTSSSGGETAASVAYDGNNYLVLWYVLKLTGFAFPFEVVGRRIAPSGAFIDAAPYLVHGRGLSLADSIVQTASITADGGGTAVVVHYAPIAAPVMADAIYATIVFDGGSSTTTGGLLLTDAGFPTVATDGKEYLVVWEDYRNAATSPDLYGERLDTTGKPIDASPVPIEVGATQPQKPHLVFNGKHYLLTWHERFADGGYGVHGRWLSTALQALNDITVDTADDEVLPRSASDGQGNTWTSLVRISDGNSSSVPRVNSVISAAGFAGDPCTIVGQCLSGFCVGGVCCNSACNAACQTCLAAQGAPANGTCGPRTAGIVCRPADGGCDAVESCDGTTINCPPDGVSPAGTVCRPSAGDCDVAETCNGVGRLCPPDGFADAGTVCQSTSLPCALPSVCSGTAITCPAVGVQPANTVCRPAAGVCDVPETCDGVVQTCPPDGFAASSVVCRLSAGQCDVPENCTGNSADCPADLRAPNTLVCRPSAGVCDVAEHCDGVSVACPPDAFAGPTQVCAPAAAGDDCDAPDTCTGTSVSCGPDLKQPDGASCNSGSGSCRTGACKPLDRSRYGWGCGGCGAGGGGLAVFGLLAGLGLMRRRRIGAGLVLGLCLLALPVRAEGARLKLIFGGVASGTGVSADTAKSVTEYVQGELSRINAYAVLSQSDLQAMLGLERQRQLMGCTESGCVTELAGALDADRLLRGDVSRIDETIVLTFSLIDARTGRSLGRATRRIESGGLSSALREVQPMLYELLNQAPEQNAAPLVMERGFGGIVVGLMADADVLAGGVAPGVTAEFSGRLFGGALTVLATPTPGVRAEGRFYPLILGTVRPYLAAGSTIFTTGLGLRGSAGAAVRFGRIHISAEAGYERYVADFRQGYSNNALVLGLGAGWQI